MNDRNKLNEIMKIVRKKIEKFIFSDDYYRCTVSFAPYSNQGFKISFEFDSCLYLKRSNDFINILRKVFRTKFKKFNYDGHEFTFLLNDENAELFTHVGKFT